METPNATGSTRLDGIAGEKAIDTLGLARVPAPGGTLRGAGAAVWLKDQTGWAPFGAAMVTRIRVPAR